jgi:hypothetical protein
LRSIVSTTQTKLTGPPPKGGRKAIKAVRFAGARLFAISVTVLQLNTQQKKPNILVIFGDDIGYSDVSAYCLGMMGYKTPNIDRLPRKAPCSPISMRSRAAQRVVQCSFSGNIRFARVF